MKYLYILFILTGCSRPPQVEYHIVIKPISDGFEVSVVNGEIIAEFTKANTDSLSMETLALIYSQAEAQNHNSKDKKLPDNRGKILADDGKPQIKK